MSKAKASQHILYLVQADIIQGDLCGAVFIDDEFEGFLKSEIGRREWMSLNGDLRRRIMTSQWEHGIKRQFDSTKASRKWVVDVTGVDSFAFTRYAGSKIKMANG